MWETFALLSLSSNLTSLGQYRITLDLSYKNAMEKRKLVQEDFFCSECRDYHGIAGGDGILTGRCMARELAPPTDPLSGAQRFIIAILLIAAILATIGLFFAAGNLRPAPTKTQNGQRVSVAARFVRDSEVLGA